MQDWASSCALAIWIEGGEIVPAPPCLGQTTKIRGHSRDALGVRKVKSIESGDQRRGVDVAGQSFNVIADLHLLAAPGP